MNLPIGIGALIALAVAVVALVLFIVDDPLTKQQVLLMVGALALSRIIP